MRRGLAWGGAGILVAAGVAYFVVQSQAKSRLAAEAGRVAAAAGCTQVEEKPDRGASHQPPYTYDQRPATSGSHSNPLPPAQSVYDTPVPEENAVHNMEHGYVFIYYRQEGDAALPGGVAQALQSVAENESKVIMAPYPGLEEGRALALGRLEPAAAVPLHPRRGPGHHPRPVLHLTVPRGRGRSRARGTMRRGSSPGRSAEPVSRPSPPPAADDNDPGRPQNRASGRAPVAHPSALLTPRRARYRGKTLVGAVVLIVAGVAALFAFGLSRDPRLLRSPLVGRRAPDFVLRTLEGDATIRLSDLRGQVVVLNFWASWCAACREEHPNFVLAWRRYRDRGVVFLGIVYQDSPSTAMSYMREMGGDWPNVLDPGSKTALAYGVYGVPETFFIDARGIVRAKQIGATSYDRLVGEVQRLLSSRGGR